MEIIDNTKISSIYGIIGFSLFGLLMGYITGLTSSEISNTLIIALFSFLSSKFFIDLNNSKKNQSKLAGISLACFSLSFLVALNLGIFVKINQLLTFSKDLNIPKASESGSQKEEDYLRNNEIFRDLFFKYRQGELTPEEKEKIIELYFSRKQ